MTHTREEHMQNVADVILWLQGYMAAKAEDSGLCQAHIESLGEARLVLKGQVPEGKPKKITDDDLEGATT